MLRNSSVAEVAIREFAPGDENAFRQLNEEWISRYFVLESKDMEALSDPQGAIVDRGGRIFLAVQEGEAVGCCALDHGPGVGSGFNRDVSVGGKVAGEVREGFPGGGKVVAMEDSSGVVEDYGFDDFLVQIERGKWHNKFTPVCGERAGSFSVQRERPPETRPPVTRFGWTAWAGEEGKGKNGTYLFELEVQPGGPEGRPDTTAGSKPIPVVGRPQGVRPCSPWMVGCSSHLVPSPVSNSRSQFARCWQVPAKQLPAGVYAMPRSNHARYDGFGNLYQKN